jgi:hypothetical protein
MSARHLALRLRRLEIGAGHVDQVAVADGPGAVLRMPANGRENEEPEDELPATVRPRWLVELYVPSAAGAPATEAERTPGESR